MSLCAICGGAIELSKERDRVTFLDGYKVIHPHCLLRKDLKDERYSLRGPSRRVFLDGFEKGWGS